MKSLSSTKKQRTNRRSSLSTPSSSFSRKRRTKRELFSRKSNTSGLHFLLRLPILDVTFASKISSVTSSVLSVALFSAFIVLLSRQNCFHVHYGLGGSLSNLESLGIEKGNGFVDYHFTGRGKVVYDQEARDILKANPDINLRDLDLGFVFDADQFGADPMSVEQKEKSTRLAPTLTSTKGTPKWFVGKRNDDALFYVTGERIRNALKKMEEQMPRPSN
ncbi:unnamed protein product [Pseudo-nitzschia multistriata]|uniref:Uncharacterized protein n=1 Tax=Pseudo-nitzschia multistriata TaxID=183589 RepID=A0A448ZCY0_9STRA|nr:unnamed protein product [Pseudo-nitzschia multistriata]